MSLTSIHGLYGVTVGAGFIGGITEQGAPTATEVSADALSGEAYARVLAVIKQDPKLTFTTKHLAEALVAASVTGVAIAAGSTVIFYAQKWLKGGMRTPGSSHLTYTLTEGLLVPRSLSVQHQQDATLGYEALITWDGSNDPIVLAATAAVPAASTAKELFSLGGITLGSIAIPAAQSLEIDFGITAEQYGADSDVWPTLAAISEIKPTLTLKGLDATLVKSAGIPLLGKVATHADTTIYLRKRAAGGTFVADATAEHIKLTAAGLVTVENVFEASGNSPGTVDLKMTCEFDGTNAPITVDAASAIT